MCQASSFYFSLHHLQQFDELFALCFSQERLPMCLNILTRQMRVNHDVSRLSSLNKLLQDACSQS
jgi:hypothetical protein